jgi:sugar (pentulose or hexulose) kinase
MISAPLALGVDIGTSGVRVVAMDEASRVVATGSAAMADHGGNWRDPETWKAAFEAALARILDGIDRSQVVAISVDGTSGTLLGVAGRGAPIGDALMYRDAVEDDGILAGIKAHAPATSAAHGPTSGLAKSIWLCRYRSAERTIHQADWIAGLLSGRFDVSDENNALKTGYDPVARDWPDWIIDAGGDPRRLPSVVPAGTVTGHVSAEAARHWGLRPDCVVVAGTTDGCASFLATGAGEIGDGVTALGSSLTVKVLCDRPVFEPRYGLYSHRIGDLWLAGGASNTGGRVLAAHFDVPRIVELTDAIDPDRSTGLDYYPLVKPGERFPIADPTLPPRLEPRPADDSTFLQAMLEGMAAIEALAYRRLTEFGAPALRSVRSVGGGARNPAWTRIRQHKIAVPFLPALSEEAAAGAARLGWQGVRARATP